jgi:hypothetical protein
MPLAAAAALGRIRRRLENIPMIRYTGDVRGCGSAISVSIPGEQGAVVAQVRCVRSSASDWIRAPEASAHGGRTNRSPARRMNRPHERTRGARPPQTNPGHAAAERTRRAACPATLCARTTHASATHERARGARPHQTNPGRAAAERTRRAACPATLCARTNESHRNARTSPRRAATPDEPRPRRSRTNPTRGVPCNPVERTTHASARSCPWTWCRSWAAGISGAGRAA